MEATLISVGRRAGGREGRMKGRVEERDLIVTIKASANQDISSKFIHCLTTAP